MSVASRKNGGSVVVQSVGEFGQQLRTLREAQGLSMRALAGIIGVSSVTVWKWEKGDSKPRARLIQPLAKALDVSARQLQSSVQAASKAEPPAGVESIDAVEATVGDVEAGATEGAASTPEQLSDVIARAKQMIAEASGTGSNNITILIEY